MSLVTHGFFITPHSGQPIRDQGQGHAHHVSMINHVPHLTSLILSLDFRLSMPPYAFQQQPQCFLITHMANILPHPFLETTGMSDFHSLRSARYIAHSPRLTFNGFPLLIVCLCDCINPFCFFLFQIDMAMIPFDTLLDCLQSSHSLLEEILTSQKGLCFGDIHFVLPRCTLNMQYISLTYLKSLISDNCFQPERIPSDAVSSSTTILILFLSDAKHTTIQHIHLCLVVHHISCNLYGQSWILPFIRSIEEDLEKVRQRHDEGKDPGGVCSSTMLVTNFGSIMAVPMDPPYCLVYPIVYNDNVAAQNQNHFTLQAAPQECIPMTLYATPWSSMQT